MISVIIPIYNVEKYLGKCLDSIIKQTYTNLEILLINDGSTDSSGTICDEYAKKDSRIRVIHQTNKGLSGARNKGLDEAKGDYIGFIDSDDIISPEFYKILHKNLVETDSDISLCNFHSFTDIKEINVNVNKNYFKSITYNGADFIESFRYKNDTVRYVIVCNKLYKKKIWNNLRFPVDVRISEDEYVWYKCFYKSNRIIEIDLMLYYYFKRDDSITNRVYQEYSFKKEISYIKALEERIEFCKSNNLTKFLNNTLIYKYKFLRKLYITTPQNKVPEFIRIEIYKNIKYIPYTKRLKIYLKDIFK